MFEATDFLSAKHEAVLDDRINPHPEGEYSGQIGVDDKALSVKTGEKDGKPWAQMFVKIETTDVSGEVEKKMGRKPFITYSFFLDLTPEGKLDQDRQKNVRLGALLKATNCAKPGWSPTDIKGKTLKFKVAMVKQDGGYEPRAEVVMVGTAS